MSKLLVTAKVNPDLDGTSCTLAYSDLLNQTGKQAEGVVTGSPQSEVKYFIDKHSIQIPTRPDESIGNWDGFVLVDASSMKGMPKVIKSEQVIEVIDHRTGEPEKEFPKAEIQNELIGAAATIVVEKFKEADKEIKPNHAKLLYGAIYHNTLNFIATNTTNRDKKAAEYLETTFKLSQNIIREMFDFATREVETNVQKALEDDAKEFGPGWKIGAYQLVVWGNEVFAQKEQVQKSVSDLRDKMGSGWSFVNIIDLESKQSHIYTNPEGEEILSKALDTKFENGWSVLPATLRKQIMPKVNQVVAKTG